MTPGNAESRVGDVTPPRTVVGTRKGRRSRVGTPLPERMARLTDVNPDGCWLWTGAVAGKGYGVINIAGRLTKAHRVSYELHVGPIPDGLVIDHLCRTPLCVRPDHLEPVTVRENTARGEGPSGKAATDARTHCPKGHPYDARRGQRHPGGPVPSCLHQGSAMTEPSYRTSLAIAVERLDAHLDRDVADPYQGQPLAQDWARVAKVVEEAGEAIAELIGMTGQNPRKGFTSNVDKLLSELADVALTGIYAMQHFTKDADDTLARLLDKAQYHCARVGVELP